MPYINQIVDIINTTLSAGKLKDDKRFVKMLHGLSELLVANQKDNVQNTIPVLIDLNGGVIFSGFNDIYSIIIYHRCIGTNIVQPPVAFGDGNNTAREEASMRMIVYADRYTTRMQPQQLSFYLSSGLQQQLTQSQITNFDGLYGATIEVNSTSYDSLALYSQEYRLDQSTFKLGPNDMYFSIDYKITTDYDVTCISDCPNC
jgi:hypothetical protein